jgi:hypothetical protein
VVGIASTIKLLRSRVYHLAANFHLVDHTLDFARVFGIHDNNEIRRVFREALGPDDLLL